MKMMRSIWAAQYNMLTITTLMDFANSNITEKKCIIVANNFCYSFSEHLDARGDRSEIY